MLKKTIEVPLRSLRYSWTRKPVKTWPMVIAQLVELAEDSQHSLEGLTLEIAPVNIIGQDAIVFGLVRTSKTRKAKVRVYFETDKEGAEVFEGISSAGIDGSCTGNRIFFLRDLVRILPIANALVIEVDDEEEKPRKPRRRSLWRRMNLSFGGGQK